MATNIFIVLLCLYGFTKGLDAKVTWDKDRLHPKQVRSESQPDTHNDFINPPEDRVQTDWYQQSQDRIQNALEQAQRMVQLHKPAKNVIFFMGDGLGISTMSAARIYMAQQRNITGEDFGLSWEKLPYAALSRTYAVDEMVPDSAATATAMVCGEKTNNNVIGSNQNTTAGDCQSQQGNDVTSILHHSIMEDKWTGVVTTARITHASPACTYAHAADRDWEADADVPILDRDLCPDIASQIVDTELNQQIKVLLGGGRRAMFPNSVPDAEYPDLNGDREDGRDLVQEWLDQKATDGVPPEAYAYVNSLDDFNDVDPSTTEYLMGLFEHDHMQYEVYRDTDTFGEPSLTEMVEKALAILEKSENGYFLFVESSKIDSAHHATWAQKALVETVQMSDAIERVLELTNENDTLLVVTADHSHVFTMSAYPTSNSNILTFSDNMVAEDDKPYATLGYTNGPGFAFHRLDLEGNEQPRRDLTGQEDVMLDPDFMYDAGVYLSSERHGGEDVGIFARGPMAHLFHGIQEQSYIGNLMMYASCVGRNKDLCEIGVPEICQ